MSPLRVRYDRIKKHWQRLIGVWQRTGDSWSDASKSQFAKQYWESLVSATNLYVKQLDSMASLVEHVRREIE